MNQVMEIFRINLHTSRNWGWDGKWQYRHT